MFILSLGTGKINQIKYIFLKKKKKKLLDSAFYYLEQAKRSPNSALFSSTGQQIHNFGFAAYFLEMKKFEMAQSYLNKNKYKFSKSLFCFKLF